MSAFNEEHMIETIGNILGNTEALSDDAYFDPDTRMVYNTDMLVEGVHFSVDYFTPQQMAHKALAVNLSDIAGMGAKPQYALVSLGLPDWVDLHWITAFYTALKQVANHEQCRIVGGDTVKSPNLVINIAMTGIVEKKSPLISRKGAKANDVILTTGYHGLSALGLHLLSQTENQREQYPEAIRAHLTPQAQTAAISTLKKLNMDVIGGMDTSDGLADAAIKMAHASQCVLKINRAQLPIHPEMTQYYQNSSDKLLNTLLYGGEDFQLLITVPESVITAEVLKYFTPIGTVLPLDDTNVNACALLQHIDGTVEELESSKTFQHF